MSEKIVLAYSGGLDTSVICRWLQDVYDREVVTFTADIGQGEEVEPARAKAEALGVKQIFVEDLREEFVRDFVFPMFRANTVYEGEYLLGTSIARPLIAKRLVEIAQATNASAIAHGATGKGNDQVRFELSAYALSPGIEIVAPHREWDLNSRAAMMSYCEQRQIPVDFKRGEESPYSMDANLLLVSYEGGELEDPNQPPSESMWRRTIAIKDAPDEDEVFTIQFERGDPVGVNDVTGMSATSILTELNEIGGRHGVGRSDIVENRFVGMKSRGCYETPGGTILLKAHRAMESMTLDREVVHLRDELMPRYAQMIYNGFWWSPERVALQALIDQTQVPVCGTVRIRVCKGNVDIVGRESSGSLYDTTTVTFDDDGGSYDQADATGFIRLNALRLRMSARKGRDLGQNQSN
ncbi:MAG: argininosuccinate synthase [Gammaproteobacteria bacterium]|nr:argininosuccinate synthase [Gammaproteobacteria bacterium]